jgi:hypothetical protein
MATYPPPVIFVPGIKGSSLRDEYPVDPENLWSTARAVLKLFERITLHPFNNRYEAQEPARGGGRGAPAGAPPQGGAR